MYKNSTLAYIIGVALGDGNLSCPNGRATRLRVTCDKNYPLLIAEIKEKLRELFPRNRVAVVNRKDNCVDVSVYSNLLNEIMPWGVNKGSKYVQKARVPPWIFDDEKYMRMCLKGLLQTDGSIYSDRGYVMINFTNHTKELVTDVITILSMIGYTAHQYKNTNDKQQTKYVARLSKNANQLLSELQLTKE